VPLERHAEGTDLWAHEQGYISVTPLRLDLTDHADLDTAAGGRPTLEFADGPDGLPSPAWKTDPTAASGALTS
jgi:hypothetical protein